MVFRRILGESCSRETSRKRAAEPFLKPGPDVLPRPFVGLAFAPSDDWLGHHGRQLFQGSF
jgi:hypothetical protein